MDKVLLMNKYIKGVFLTSFSTILFGFNPLFVFFLQTSNVNLLFTLYTRFIGSIVVYFIIIRANKIKLYFITDLITNLKLFFCSLFFVLTAFLLIYSYTLIASGLTTLLHFFYPIIITIMSVFAKRTKMNLPLFLSIVFSLIGVVFVTNPFDLSVNLFGISTALLSAFTFAIYLFILNDPKIKVLENNIFILYLSIFSLLIIIGFSLFNLDLYNCISNIKLNYISIIGGILYIIASAFGVSLFSRGARIVGGPIASTIGAFEPLTAVFVGILFFNDKSPSYYLIGVFLIIISTIIIALFSPKRKSIKNII